MHGCSGTRWFYVGPAFCKLGVEEMIAKGVLNYIEKEEFYSLIAHSNADNEVIFKSLDFDILTNKEVLCYNIR